MKYRLGLGSIFCISMYEVPASTSSIWIINQLANFVRILINDWILHTFYAPLYSGVLWHFGKTAICYDLGGYKMSFYVYDDVISQRICVFDGAEVMM